MEIISRVTLIARSTSAEVGANAALGPYRIDCATAAIKGPTADRLAAPSVSPSALPSRTASSPKRRSTRAATPHRSSESQRTRRPSPRHNATPPRRRNESSTIFHARNFRRPEGRSASRASAPQRPSRPSSVAARTAAEDLSPAPSSPLFIALRPRRSDSPSADDAVISGARRTAQEPTGDTDQSPQHSARPAIVAASETTSAFRKK